MSKKKKPGPEPILELMDGFRKSKTLFTALTLGVFELLEEGPLQAAVLAERTGTKVEALTRLLESCVSLGLLTRAGAAFENADVAQVYLTQASADTLAGYIRYSDEALYPLWGNLGDAVRQGGHRWQQTFGLSGNALFERFFHTDEAMSTFLAGMQGFGMLSSPAVVRAFDLSGFRKMVDLGGGTGHLAAAASALYPDLHATVFDLPRVIGFASHMPDRFPVGDRVDWLAGDLFEGDLPGADLYALGRILHDWSEEKIRLLLGRIAGGLPAGGGLLIAEKLLAEDRGGPVHVTMQSLNMLVCTEGRERSLSEYRSLLREAGFENVRGVVTGQPLDAILASKR